jgi:methionine-S-sulfoxide reductase
MFLGHPGSLPAREGRDQRDFRLLRRLSQDRRIRSRQHRRNRTRRVGQIVYDPSQITYGELLRVFFSVAHDPTQLNRQGPDEGTQYRSSIFYANDEQKRIAQAYIAQLDKAGVFPRPIVTQVVPLQAFYPAEAYHQNYAALHPNQPYIVFNDAPEGRASAPGVSRALHRKVRRRRRCSIPITMTKRRRKVERIFAAARFSRAPPPSQAWRSGNGKSPPCCKPRRSWLLNPKK